MAKKEAKYTDQINYVEPNDVDYEYEDLSIILKLRVIIPDRNRIDIADGENEYEITWEGKKRKMKEIGNGDNSYLSTAYSDISFMDAYNGGNSEAFGISNVVIEHNPWFFPEVTVKFVDIRASALYGVASNSRNTFGVKTNSLFQTFFTFPYPNFNITIKGFFGPAVTFSLVAQSFKASYNTNSGSFDATAKFIGNIWGCLADIPMKYLFVAPYLNQASLGKFPGSDIDIPKISDIVKIFADARAAEENYLKNSDEAKNLGKAELTAAEKEALVAVIDSWKQNGIIVDNQGDIPQKEGYEDPKNAMTKGMIFDDCLILINKVFAPTYLVENDLDNQWDYKQYFDKANWPYDTSKGYQDLCGAAFVWWNHEGKDYKFDQIKNYARASRAQHVNTTHNSVEEREYMNTWIGKWKYKISSKSYFQNSSTSIKKPGYYISDNGTKWISVNRFKEGSTTDTEAGKLQYTGGEWKSYKFDISPLIYLYSPDAAFNSPDDWLDFTITSNKPCNDFGDIPSFAIGCNGDPTIEKTICAVFGPGTARTTKSLIIDVSEGSWTDNWHFDIKKFELTYEKNTQQPVYSQDPFADYFGDDPEPTAWIETRPPFFCNLHCTCSFVSTETIKRYSYIPSIDGVMFNSKVEGFDNFSYTKYFSSTDKKKMPLKIDGHHYSCTIYKFGTKDIEGKHEDAEKAREQTIEDEKKLKENAHKEFLKAIPFPTTIRNMFYIIFAHLTCFIKQYGEVIDNIMTSNRNIPSGLVKDTDYARITDNFLGPWPQVYSKVEPKQIIYPGYRDEFSKMIELDYVQELFEAAKASYNLYLTSLGALNSYEMISKDLEGNAAFFPTLGTDFLHIKTNPYQKIIENGKENKKYTLAAAFCARYMIRGYCGDSNLISDDKTWACIEAYNLFLAEGGMGPVASEFIIDPTEWEEIVTEQLPFSDYALLKKENDKLISDLKENNADYIPYYYESLYDMLSTKGGIKSAVYKYDNDVKVPEGKENNAIIMMLSADVDAICADINTLMQSVINFYSGAKADITAYISNCFNPWLTKDTYENAGNFHDNYYETYVHFDNEDFVGASTDCFGDKFKYALSDGHRANAWGSLNSFEITRFKGAGANIQGWFDFYAIIAIIKGYDPHQDANFPTALRSDTEFYYLLSIFCGFLPFGWIEADGSNWQSHQPKTCISQENGLFDGNCYKVPRIWIAGIGAYFKYKDSTNEWYKSIANELGLINNINDIPPILQSYLIAYCEKFKTEYFDTFWEKYGEESQKHLEHAEESKIHKYRCSSLNAGEDADFLNAHTNYFNGKCFFSSPLYHGFWKDDCKSADGYGFVNEGSVGVVKETCQEFYNGIKALYESSSSDGSASLSNTDNSLQENDVLATRAQKLAIYNTLKNLYDRWQLNTKTLDKIATSEHDFANFVFCDSFRRDIGDKLKVNLDTFFNICSMVMDANGGESEGMSVYAFMYEVCKQSDCMFMTMPIDVYSECRDNKIKFKEMFEPIPYSKYDNNFERPPAFLCIYTSKPSEHLGGDNNTGGYRDDGANFLTDDVKIMTEEDGKNDKKIPLFGVTYGYANQHLFKNVTVNMDNPKNTEYSLKSTLFISQQGEERSVSTAGYVGQDTYNAYANSMYTCTVNMLGNINIQPMMYFQLNNIPLFRGTYIVTKVVHNVKCGNMDTTFTGVRLNKYYINYMKDELDISQAFQKFEFNGNAGEVRAGVSNAYDVSHTFTSVTVTLRQSGTISDLSSPTPSGPSTPDQSDGDVLANPTVTSVWANSKLGRKPTTSDKKPESTTTNLIPSDDVADWIITVNVDTMSSGVLSIQVAKPLKNNVIKIFEELKAAGFNVKQISGFTFRYKDNGGKSTSLSNHAYGCAIDINICENPYIDKAIIADIKKKGDKWTDTYKDKASFKINDEYQTYECDKAFIEELKAVGFNKTKLKDDDANGKIRTKNSTAVKILAKYGYTTWGGTWGSQDLQHFELKG